MSSSKILTVVAVLVAVMTGSAMARGRVVVVRPRPVMVSHRPVYVHRPVIVHRPVRFYQPVYCAPRPVMYVQPPVVVQAEPVYVQASAPIVQQLHIPEGFVETGRDLHSHGSDAGLVDEIHGVLNGKKVTIEYNDDGTIEEIEDD